MSEILEIKERIDALVAQSAELARQREKLHDFVDLFLSYEAEGSAAHRAAKLVDLKMAARKLKR